MENKMPEEVIGKVLDKANTESFQFVSTRFFQTDFVKVKVDHAGKGARIIGEIVSKEAINPYFDKPTIIRYIEENDENIIRHSLYLSKVKPLALIHNDIAGEVDFPPLPGSNVFPAEESDISIALGLEKEGIDIGYLKGYNLPFKISPEKLLRTHIAILGQTGSGKSYLAAKIIVELMKSRHYANVPSQIAIPVIFDTSGEYISGGYKDLALIMNILKMHEHHFPLLNKKYISLLKDIYDLDAKQHIELREWLVPSIENISSREIEQNSQQPLMEQAGVKQLINLAN